jgi:hypothetical protein
VGGSVGTVWEQIVVEHRGEHGNNEGALWGHDGGQFGNSVGDSMGDSVVMVWVQCGNSIGTLWMGHADCRGQLGTLWKTSRGRHCSDTAGQHDGWGQCDCSMGTWCGNRVRTGWGLGEDSVVIE